MRAFVNCSGDITELANRMIEYTACSDVSSNIWKAMETLLKDQEKPEDRIIQNLLHIIEKLPTEKNKSDVLLCNSKCKTLYSYIMSILLEFKDFKRSSLFCLKMYN